jgi:hypothetical protein
MWWYVSVLAKAFSLAVHWQLSQLLMTLSPHEQSTFPQFAALKIVGDLHFFPRFK